MTGPRPNVWNEASAAGMWLGRTHLTGMAPRSPNSGTAQGFCADNSTQLALAHLVGYQSEARAGPVIYAKNRKPVSITVKIRNKTLKAKQQHI